MTDSPLHDVIVVGAGISGLASAYWLKRQGFRVLVLEKDSEPGGTMKTVREDGFLVETGPNSALETTPLFRELIRECGLEHDVLYANPVGKNRFILRDGTMHVLPLGPSAFIASRLFSIRGKLRLLGEPFIRRASEEESIAEFVTRRLGKEFLDYAIDPFVAGVFAGKPELLSVRSAFPKLYALEEQYGGLVRGMIGGARARRRRVEKSKDRAESFSFTEGMQMLPAALAHRLGNDLTVSCTVTGVHHDDGVYTITATESGAGRTVRSRGLIISVPAFAAAEFLAPMSRDTAEVLRSIEYSPVASVFLSYRKEDVLHPLNGFGVLIPQKERRKILGVLWSSSLFPRRAPDGLAAFTAFVGGARQPEQLTGTDEDVRAIAEEELASIMQIMGKPVYYRVTRWQKAIPQYTLGYERKMDALAGWSATHPGLALCGNYIGGISVGDCVMSARHTADQLSAFLRTVSQ